MKWLRFEHRGRASFGQLDGESVVVFEGDMFGDKKPTGEIVPLSGIKWLTPSAPSKMIGLWNNFRAVAEKNGWAVPAEPLYFIKAANSYRAHGEAILAPIAYDGRVVYEGELAVVIGKTVTAVSPEKAPAHIFGYTCANDVTAADLTRSRSKLSAMEQGQRVRYVRRVRPGHRDGFRSRRGKPGHARQRAGTSALSLLGHDFLSGATRVVDLARPDALPGRRHHVRHVIGGVASQTRSARRGHDRGNRHACQ